MKNRPKILLTGLLLAGMINPIFGADKSKKEAMSKDAMQAKMAEMAKLSSPNENHNYLETTAGSWENSGKWWMSADSTKPEKFKGTNENKWIHGNRFLQIIVAGKMMGQEFEGMGILGYDNIRKEYNSLWLDNMATGMMLATAQFDPKTKTLTEKGTYSCPITGMKNRPYRSVLKLISDDKYKVTMYTSAMDKIEYKSMEIIYKRTK